VLEWNTEILLTMAVRVSFKGILRREIISLHAFNANHIYGGIDANFYLS
jgi:hypothetical protein